MAEGKPIHPGSSPAGPSNTARGGTGLRRRPLPGRPAGSPRGHWKGIYRDVSFRFKKDPIIEHSLRRLEGRPEAAPASSIISLLARRGTGLPTLRRVAEQIAGFKAGRQAARAVDVLGRAVVRDSHAAILLSTLLLRNPGLLQVKTDALILFGRIYPLIENPGIIDGLGPEQVQSLAAAFQAAVAAFPTAAGAAGESIEDVFFDVLNLKLRNAETPIQKIHVITKWAENLVSILNATDPRFA